VYRAFVERAIGAYAAQKKSLSDALEYAAQRGMTNHEKLRDVELARLINVQCGAAFVAPWEVGQLDEEWIDVFKGLADLPRMRESYQAFDRKLSEIRAKHPTYRKYLN